MKLRKRFAAWLALALLTVPAVAQTPAPYDYRDISTTPFSMGSQTQFGALTYAGGLFVNAPGTALFGGVSGLVVQAGEPGTVKFAAITDAGQFMTFTGALGEDGKLIGAGNLAMAPLRDIGGEPPQSKRQGDAEDLTRPVDGPGWLVSFEGRHRITAYADPFNAEAEVFDTNMPAEAARLPSNQGMEALAALPGNRLAVGAEDGRIWLCPAKGGCALVHKKGGMGFLFWLTSLDYLPGTSDELVSTWRRPSPLGGYDIIVAHVVIKDGHTTVTNLANLPSYVDNIEGIAALARSEGGYRLYLVSDNNFGDRPTKLLAFDWKP